MDDADLVGAYLAGDIDAFAQIYDRYADRIHDFCHSVLRDRAEAADAMQDTFIIAARRVGQLREPAKLRSWLFAIARNESLRRAKKQARAIPTDEFRDLAAADITDADVNRTDLQELVWSAAAGLSERDRALLDLHLRQGLDGQELADAIGVAPSHAYVMMNRLRSQMERALGALLIARLGKDECAELAALLRDWDGTFSVLIRKRVARHVDDCDVCSERRRALVSPLALLAAVPLIPAALHSRARVLDRVEMIASRTPAADTPSGGAPDPADPSQSVNAMNAANAGYRWNAAGFPRPLAAHRRGPGRRAYAFVAAAALVVGAGGGAFLAAADDGGRGGGIDVIAPDSTSTSSADLSSSTTAATARSATSSSTTAPTTTTTSATPTTTDAVTVTTATPGPATTTTAPPTDSPPSLKLTIAPTEIWTSSECGATVASLEASAFDDHGVVDVSFTYVSKYAGDGFGSLTYDDPSWYGVLGPLSTLGNNDTVTVRVTAKDTIGQQTTITRTVTLSYCLI
jgi:RNA polymerase sigma factor (sigma-70 family)